MSINTKELEVPFYLVLEDDDIQKGLDEVTSKIKKSGKIVENEFIKKFSDAEDKFQTLIKLGDKLYSVVGRLNKKGGMDARTKPQFTEIQNLSEAKTLLYSKKYSQYNDNLEKLAIARVEKVRKEAEKEDAKNRKKEQQKLLKQKYFDDSMGGFMGLLSSRNYASSREFKDIGKQIASAISKATTAGLDISKGTQASALYDSEYARMSGNVSNIGSIFKGILSPMQIAKLELDEVRAKMRDLQEEIMFLGEGGRVDGLKKDLKELAQQAEKLEKKTKKSFIASFFERLKSYGLLRVVRNLFMSIEKGFSSGLTKLIQFDDAANSTFSSISSSFDKINASIALSLFPIIKAFEPAIVNIANAFADFANNISIASSMMQGLSTYTKISEKYMKDLREQSNALSFDKFESLGAETDIFDEGNLSDLSEEEIKRAEEYKSKLNGIVEIIQNIIGIVKQIGIALGQIWQVIEPHFNTLVDFIIDVIKWITNLIVKIMEVANNVGGLSTLLTMILGVFIAIKSAQIANLFLSIAVKVKTLNASLTTTLTLMSAFIGVIGGIAGSIKATKSIANWDENTTGAQMFLDVLKKIVSVGSVVAGLIGLFTGNPIALGVGIIGGIGVNMFANGGMVDSGSLFVAGEAGAELVTTMPSGQTGVTNVAQFKQAMVEAIYECADVFQQPDGSVALYLDGREVARSKNFKDELNRTNAGLNLR